MNVFQATQDACTPAGQAYEDGGRGADAPEQRVPHTRVAQGAADSAIHGKVDGKDDSKKYGEEVKRNLHVRSPSPGNCRAHKFPATFVPL